MKRRLMQLLGVYTSVGEHTIKTKTERFEKSPIGSAQASVEHVCVDCGERQKRKSVFSCSCGDGEYNTGGCETEVVPVLVTSVSHNRLFLNVLSHDGHRCSVPTWHSAYSEQTADILNRVEVNDKLELSLIAENAEQTSWRVGVIESPTDAFRN